LLHITEKLFEQPARLQNKLIQILLCKIVKPQDKDSFVFYSYL